ncbi:hypothetical protein [Sphingobacterium humi]|uniref:Uncharacterized protein n=1 Tax=Sphingobacterium humi TaxID=1796905 RepID=A0A6N8KXH2_9SPHI|nr:hypothetical protein [Sphingobacterium humi]MVZ62145.1 hypothetical protein [Sphingobacterium humi]
MARKYIIKYYSKENFNANNFNRDAEDLAQEFRNDETIKSYKYLGIDPNPQEGDNIKVIFEYEVS